ncbi:MAG: TusE/DsrC/DsvC family sulfur relay protein [Anaerolineae bacterium]|nr:TusE/DsrC/DsvC family sulfur relay protein [Thermoflexales bacterium]MDW8395829.1 TusE/DsrC/DsvC family sulfur relay protein [Anaerolineae bacterium]
MTTRVLSGMTVEVNEEGFLLSPDAWTPELAVEIAREEGIEELTPAHWQVIEWCRKNAVNGRSPTLRQITAGTGLSTKELFALFPKGPAKKVARIAGLGKPEGCV